MKKKKIKEKMMKKIRMITMKENIMIMKGNMMKKNENIVKKKMKMKMKENMIKVKEIKAYKLLIIIIIN